MSSHAKGHSKVPTRREAYTTYLYWGFAFIFLILLVLGFTAF